MKKIILTFVVIFMACFFACEGAPSAPENDWDNDVIGTGNVSKSGVEIVLLKNNIPVSGPVVFKIFQLYSDGTKTELILTNCSISISDTSIINYDTNNQLTALKEGSCEISVSCENFTDSVEITVYDNQYLQLLKISEVLYDAEGSDSGLEFIKITNFSNVKIDIC